jgi:hypothetical protein
MNHYTGEEAGKILGRALADAYVSKMEEVYKLLYKHYEL